MFMARVHRVGTLSRLVFAENSVFRTPMPVQIRFRITSDADAVHREDEIAYVPFGQTQRRSSRFSARAYPLVTRGDGSGQGCADFRARRSGRLGAGSGGGAGSVADRLHARGCRGGP